MATQPTSPPIIPALSEAPNSATDTPTEFDAKANNFVASQASNVSNQNQLADWQNSTAQEVYDNAVESKASADEAELQANKAADEAVTSQIYANFSQQAANFLGVWSDLSGAVSLGEVVVHNSVRWQANKDIANVAASEPSGLNTDWIIISDQNVILSGGDYNMPDPSGLADGHKINFVRAKGVTNARVISSFSDFKTDFGDYDTIVVGNSYGFSATIYNGIWEV